MQLVLDGKPFLTLRAPDEFARRHGTIVTFDTEVPSNENVGILAFRKENTLTANDAGSLVEWRPDPSGPPSQAPARSVRHPAHQAL